MFNYYHTLCHRGSSIDKIDKREDQRNIVYLYRCPLSGSMSFSFFDWNLKIRISAFLKLFCSRESFWCFFFKRKSKVSSLQTSWNLNQKICTIEILQRGKWRMNRKECDYYIWCSSTGNENCLTRQQKKKEIRQSVVEKESELKKWCNFIFFAKICTNLYLFHFEKNKIVFVCSATVV